MHWNARIFVSSCPNRSLWQISRYIISVCKTCFSRSDGIVQVWSTKHKILWQYEFLRYYPTCNLHPCCAVLCYVICDLSSSFIFLIISQMLEFSTVFGMNLVFWFSLPLFETFLIQRRDSIINLTHVFIWGAPYVCPVLIKLEFLWQVLVTLLAQCKISRKSFRWEPSCSMRTDGQT